MEIIVIHWNVAITRTENTLQPNPPEVVNVLPGDSIVFTGAPATVTFPPGLTTPLSGPAPGTFRINPSARDGHYTYRIDSASEDVAGVAADVKVGLDFLPKKRVVL